MTLILNAATQGFIVHASDRLLTKRVGGKSRIHSDVENKSLIVLAKDAICIIGYSGAAYIGNVITDQWIASTITGLDLTGDFMLRCSRIGGLRLNTLLRRLELAMTSLRLPGDANYLGISVSGVRQRGRYCIPFIREIERNKGVVRGGGYMRYPRAPNFHGLSSIGALMPMGELQQVIGREFASGGICADSFQRGMINAIRAHASDTVGDEIMTIAITRSQERWDVVWTFDSPNPRLAVIIDASDNLKHVFESFFSPWVITPFGVTKPSFGNGHFNHVVGGVTVRCGNKVVSTPEQGSFFAVTSQGRARLQ
jgi:hypothetical protein